MHPSLATNYTYDKMGRMQSVTLPNTVISTYGYDDDGQLTSLAHVKGAQMLSTFQYQYDEIGNRTRVAETVFQPTLQNTGLKSPTAQAPNTADGDKNGFEVNPAYALADGGGFAVDNKSGTNNSTNCDDAGKDKHNFYNFNITFPVNTTIQGIEARLDAKVNNTSNTPQMCVELSWNGGTSWTAAKKTPTLSTSETTYLLGGSSDAWGRTWSMTDFSNTNLRVRVINVASATNKNFSLDWIAVKVYYKTTPTVDYTYDPLYRLTRADYNDGRYYHYSYDAVGNRLTEQTQAGNTTYSYDNANRLTSVNGINYTWDNNGNLLSDGVYTYSYDRANRLKTASGQGSNYSFGYNGNGDRLRQTVNSVTTNYTLDLNAGLTQVLSDGGITYLYGNGRILQDRGTSKEHFLVDALGSVRQLTDASGAVILGKSYQPYGKVLDSSGSGSSSYGFTGEWTDATGLINLRARYYAPGVGRFITRDIWEGNDNQPMSYNDWLYTYDNPINKLDPTGKYGGDKIHDSLTEKRVEHWAGIFPIPALNGDIEKLAKAIGLWDRQVDYSPYLISIGVCGSCHFMPYETTISHVDVAIELGWPYLFGGAVHQLQDYFSHWREGYYDQILGHGAHSLIALTRGEALLSDFFYGGHYYDNYPFPGWMPSPYPAHPREEVLQNVRQRNPGVELTGLSDWEIVDLYLRKEMDDPNHSLRFAERDYFGFNTDLYVPTSKRDRYMTAVVDSYLFKFVQRLAREKCIYKINELPPDGYKERVIRELISTNW